MKGEGKFITLEGIDGAGKTTQLDVIRRYLEQRGIRVLATREPGGSPVGDRIRALLLAPPAAGMGADTEVLLLFAARAEHIAAKIRPALEQGTWVLSDRFTDSTYAYQIAHHRVDPKRIAMLEDYVQGSMRPDLTLLLDLQAASARTRAGKRSAPDRFESEAQPFFEDVRAQYLKLARVHPQRVSLIDADQPVEQVSAQVRKRISDFLAGIDP